MAFNFKEPQLRTPIFFATQIKTNVSASILTKMHSVASSLEGAIRESWIQGFIDLDGLELLTSVIAQIDAAMMYLSFKISKKKKKKLSVIELTLTSRKLAPDLDVLYSCIRCVRLIGSTEVSLEVFFSPFSSILSLTPLSQVW